MLNVETQLLYSGLAGLLAGQARYHSDVKVKIRMLEERTTTITSVEQFHRCGRLGETFEPLESVVDKDPVLVRLSRVVVGWRH